MNNEQFLSIVTDAFKVFLLTGSRSNEKLKVLHGAIAEDLQNRIGSNYKVYSLGFGDGKESEIKGRYIRKKVDITVTQDDVPIAGIGVKFVMQNYSQNSNNYFENMLGETANIRCNNIPYFQIFIIPDRMPYYDNKGVLKNWETFSLHNAKKYFVLSRDNVELMAHTPVKTLLFVVHIPDLDETVKNKNNYILGYVSMPNLLISESETVYGQFSSAVIYNDYEDFIEKVAYRILSE